MSPERSAFLDNMIIPDRVRLVAERLFPEDRHEGDCRAEVGREGLPCRTCAERNARWADRLAQVRQAMRDAFA